MLPIMLCAIQRVAHALANLGASLPEPEKGIDMNKRTIIFAALLGALTSPAYADGFRFVGGEAVWAYVGATRNSLTREQVQSERKDLQRNPVTADGWKQVGGEAGWLYVGPQRQNTPEQIARARGDSKLDVASSDGWKQVNGEAGWLYVGPQVERLTSMEASSAIR